MLEPMGAAKNRPRCEENNSMDASAPNSQQTLRGDSLRVVVTAALLLTLTACTVQKPFRFAPRTVSRITYDPKNCVEMPNGKFKCKDVIFTVATVEVPRDK